MLLEFFLIIFLVLILVMLLTKHTDAYSGTYTCEKNTNESLILNTDKSFKIVSILGKDDAVFNGTYKISNNRISLFFNDKNMNLYDENIHYGKIYGSEIDFENIRGESLKFNKL